MVVVLAGGLSGWSTHKPRGQDMKRVETALVYDALLTGLPSIPLRTCFFHPQISVCADSTVTNILVFLGPLISIPQVSAWLSPLLGGLLWLPPPLTPVAELIARRWVYALSPPRLFDSPLPQSSVQAE